MHVLKDKTVIITGASRGLGRHIAEKLAKASCHLILLARDHKQLQVLQQNLLSHGGKVDIIVCDLSDSISLDSAVNQLLQRETPVDILINNAGTGWYKGFLDHSRDEHDQIMNVNFKAVVHLSQAVLPGMLKQGYGHIVNIASDLSQKPLANMSVYVASKHAVRGFSHSLLREVKDKGVRVSLVNPGIIDTDFNDGSEGSKDASWSLRPAEVADIIVMILSQPGYQLVDEINVHPLMQDF